MLPKRQYTQSPHSIRVPLSLDSLLRYPLSDSFPLLHLYTHSHSMSIALTSVVIVTSEESGVKLCERTVVVPTGKV